MEPPEAKKESKKKNPATSSKTQKRFVGVRQRPSGRWVAEIKDSTQKLRLWLGTFDNAEDAARAYDDAARALRGANTRTNFKATSSTARLSGTTRLLLQRLAMRTNNNNSVVQQPPSPPPPVATNTTTTTTTTSCPKQKSVYGAFIEKITKAPLTQSSSSFQDVDDVKNSSNTYGNMDPRFMSSSVRAPSSNKYKVAPSIHVYPNSSSADVPEFINESPIILGNEATSPKSADSSECLWLSYLCAVS